MTVYDSAYEYIAEFSYSMYITNLVHTLHDGSIIVRSS
jgi:hypothetical protein